MNITSGHSKGANKNNLLQKHLLILKQTLGHKRYNADPRKAPHLVEELCILSGAPNVNFRKISVRKMIGDLEFSEHLL